MNVVRGIARVRGLGKVHEVIFLLTLDWGMRQFSNLKGKLRMKCSCPSCSVVVSSRSAIMPASTHTAFHCAPSNSSVLRASSSKLTSGPVDILREWISRIRARAVSPGSGNSILRSSRPERRSAGSRMSIRFVAAMTWTANQYTDVNQTC